MHYINIDENSIRNDSHLINEFEMIQKNKLGKIFKKF